MSISELFAYLTLNLGLDAEYVLDRMEGYETNALTKYNYYKHKDFYDMTRMIAFYLVNAFSKKKYKQKEIIEFPWEQEYYGKSDVDIKQDMERLMKATQIIQDQLHAKANGRKE